MARSDGEGGHGLAGAGAGGRDGVRVLGGGRAAAPSSAVRGLGSRRCSGGWRAAAARALRRRNYAPVTADEESFTATWRHTIRSMTSSQVTVSTVLEAIAAAAHADARAALHTLSVPGRQRHSRRAQKARPKFPPATATKVTVTGKPQVVTVFASGFS
jgi:hypothetical protein